MKLFISYSSGDLSLVSKIADQLRPMGEVFYWDQNKEPGTEAWNHIFDQIDRCDVVLAVITDKTVSRAMAVGNEIGRAKTKYKTIIPLVSKDVSSAELGCLNGTTYQNIDRENPVSAITEISNVLLRKKRELQIGLFILVLIAITGLMWLASKKSTIAA